MMGNMSYCRFRNTLGDLRDCYEYWDELDNIGPDELPNEGEVKARARLLKVCQDIVTDFGEA